MDAAALYKKVGAFLVEHGLWPTPDNYALAYALIAIPTPFDDQPYVPLAKLVIILAMLPMLWLWVLGSLPRGVPVSDVPPRALPEISEAGDGAA